MKKFLRNSSEFSYFVLLIAKVFLDKAIPYWLVFAPLWVPVAAMVIWTGFVAAASFYAQSAIKRFAESQEAEAQLEQMETEDNNSFPQPPSVK